MTARRRPICAFALAAGVLLADPAVANPFGPSVVSGQAAIQAQGKTLTISNAPGTIINWQGFSIARDELTRFIQSSATSAVLNRVTGGSPSDILGRLSSNGRVFLINPSGIAFGAGAVVDVAGFVASTLHLSDADFLAGRLRFSGTGREGAILNQGEIATPAGGNVFLIAPRIENSGLIRAPSGEIVLSAGKSVRLLDSAYPSIQVELSAPADRDVPLGDLATSPTSGVFGFLVRNSGVISASSAVASAGRITLQSAGRTELAIGSRLEASATGAGDGGHIEVSASQSLRIAGSIDTRAASGNDGQLLIDPAQITIVAGSTGLPAALGDASWMAVEDLGAQSLGARDLASLLDSTSVTLQASEKITVSAAIVVSAASPRTLTLQAPRIEVQRDIRSNGAPLTLVLEALAGEVRVGPEVSLALEGGALRVAARTVALAPARSEDVNTGLARATQISEIERLRREVEAEITRDRERVAAAMQLTCRSAATLRQGCNVSTAPKRNAFGV